MRPLLWLVFSVALLVALAEDLVGRNELMRSRLQRTSTHCGCVNKNNCTEPCSTCCGPNGYSDCFKNPSPSCCSVTSGG